MTIPSPVTTVPQVVPPPPSSFGLNTFNRLSKSAPACEQRVAGTRRGVCSNRHMHMLIDYWDTPSTRDTHARTTPRQTKRKQDPHTQPVAMRGDPPTPALTRTEHGRVGTAGCVRERAVLPYEVETADANLLPRHPARHHHAAHQSWGTRQGGGTRGGSNTGRVGCWHWARMPKHNTTHRFSMSMMSNMSFSSLNLRS